MGNDLQEALEGELGYKGERGYSTYELAVQNGFEGTLQDYLDHYGVDLSNYVSTDDVVDNLTSEYTTRPLSAKQGKELKTLVDNKYDKETVDSMLADINGRVLYKNPGNVYLSVDSTLQFDSTGYDELEIFIQEPYRKNNIINFKLIKTSNINLENLDKNEPTIELSFTNLGPNSLNNYRIEVLNIGFKWTSTGLNLYKSTINQLLTELLETDPGYSANFYKYAAEINTSVGILYIIGRKRNIYN